MAPHYDNNFVSGKNYGESVRYHYENGNFKSLNNSSRVVFIQHKEEYRDILKKNFNKIIQFEIVEKVI
ncbi:MAG TPA: hypothetical protein PL041_10675 [Melioribacteraceae bacterium]|nr:hypothetical protein [Melioribacteraceae bacterium]